MSLQIFSKHKITLFFSVLEKIYKISNDTITSIVFILDNKVLEFVELEK